MTKTFKLGSTVICSAFVGHNELTNQTGKVVGRLDDLYLVEFNADVDGHNGLGLLTRGSHLKGWKENGNRSWFVSASSLAPVAAEPTAPMAKAVLDLLRRKGAITSLEAQGVLRCRQLPARVLDLKRLGHSIVTEMKIDPTGQKYARYHLQAAA